MSEPIAVAFVEVRPETEDFKANAERDIQALTDDVTIRGEVELDGITDARRQVANLGQDLSGLGGEQLQFRGLESAVADTKLLQDELQRVSAVTVAPQFEPLLQSVRSLREEADQLASRLSGDMSVSVDTEGIDEALSQTAQLDEAQSSLNDTLGTTATAAGTLITRYPQLIKSEQQLSTATAETAAQARAASVEEDRLLKVRSRRASAVGPFRVAGIGLLAGTAIFGATRALGDLTEALAVSGNEATTASGKMRNFASNVLGGDIVGAFKALTNETYQYSQAQLQLINQTPELEEALRSMGRGADIAKSRLAELAKLSQEPVPQFVQTQIAVARESGDPTALREALERAEESVDAALEKAKSLRPNQKALAREIAARRSELAQVRNEIARLGREDATDRTGGFPVGRSAGLDPLSRLERREREIEEQLRGFARRRDEGLPAFNAAREALANAKRAQREAIQEAVRAEAEEVLAPLAEAVTDARLTDDADRIIAALRAQSAGLARVIDGFEGSAEDRKRFKDELVAVNKTIESTQKEINAEAERHRQEMIDNRLAPTEEAIIDATVAEVSTIPARQARIAQIETILANGMIGGKKLSRDQRIALKNELAAQNAAIESEQDAITAENERHRQAMEDKLNDADRSFIAALGGREEAIRNRQIIEQGRTGLQGDIAVSNELQRFFQSSIKLAKERINDARERAETVASLRRDLAREVQNERQLRAQQRGDAAERRLERADLAIQLAQANENRRAEIKAHQAKIALLRERIENTRRGSVERQRLRVEVARERAAIRQLREEIEGESEDGANFSEQAFKFLQEMRGFASNLAGNVIAPGATLSPPPRQPGVVSPVVQPGRKPPVGVEELAVDRRATPSPFERPDQKAAAALREGEGQPATAGQMSTLIAQTRTTNTLLGDIKRGIGHPEAKTSRDLARHRGSTTSVS